MNTDKPITEITDKSGDHKYFTLIPRIVFALVDDPFQLVLWAVVKDVAGEEGTCILSIPELAVLSMMSAGKLHESLHALMLKGLLFGEVKKDNGYHKGVWHITVPDLWKRNLDWALSNRSLKARIQLKAGQKERSPHERSYNEDERSPEGNERSPGVIKEELKEELIEERIGISQNGWVSVLLDLQGKMEKRELGTFREYYEPTYILAIEDDKYIIAVPDERRRAWLEARGTKTIERSLAGIDGQNHTVEFRVVEGMEP